jgi:putative transposase
MTSYPRNLVAGATYFFTVNLANRRSRLLVATIDLLRAAFHTIRRRHPFTVDAVVILPDHVHAIWTLPQGDSDYATRWNLIKGAFSRGLAAGEPLSASRASRRERGIWQRRYWEHTIRNDDDLVRHIDYIHFNPVKHRHVEHVADWPYSSFHRFVRHGLYPADWGTDVAGPEGGFGERHEHRRMG